MMLGAGVTEMSVECDNDTGCRSGRNGSVM